MNLQEILQRLNSFCDWTKENLDNDAKEWGRLKSRKEHEKEIRDIKLAELKLKFEGSDASQTTQAKAHPAWKEFIDEQIKHSAEYHTADYQKGFREKLIEVLRSLLSFHKTRVEQDI